MPGNRTHVNGLLGIHFAGMTACLLIAGLSVYFAGNAIAKRRGLFLSARQELASIKSELNKSVNQQATLASRVQVLEQETAQYPDLVSVTMLNARTAKIAELAESAHVSVVSLQPLERITEQRVPIQPLEFYGTTGAAQIFEFLGLLNNKMPDIHIQSIELSSEAIQAVQIQVVMVLYWYTDPLDGA